MTMCRVLHLRNGDLGGLRSCFPLLPARFRLSFGCSCRSSTSFFLSEQCSAAVNRAAKTSVFLLERGRARLVDFETVIVKQFVAGLNRLQGVDENAVSFLDRLAIGVA